MTRSAQRTTSDKPANELEILTKIEAMIAYCYTSTNQFPKAEKPGLARELRADSWELLRLVVVCNKRYHKKTTMQEVDALHEVLRRKIKISHVLKFLPLRKYEHWARLNDEIGKMIGGWIESQKALEQKAVELKKKKG